MNAVTELIAAWNARDLDRMEAVYAPDCVVEDVVAPTPLRGWEAIRGWVGPYWEAFPDLAFTVEEVVAEEDRAALLWTAHGTHGGALMGIPPTGREVRFRGSSFLTLREGRIAKALYVWDLASLLRQLGVG